MGRLFITPEQDASIYEQFRQRNTGFDEILEIGKSRGASGSIRGLVQFDVDGILSASGGSGVVPFSSSFYINLRIANATNFQRNQTIEFYQVSESWDEGTGFFEQDLENPEDGATWQIRNDADATWSLAIGSSSLGGTTRSLVTTHAFDWKPDDVRIDITGTVRAWLTGSFNGGLLLKIPTADEEGTKIKSNIRFFSRNTHTIYPPTLEAIWPTQTMSLQPNCGLVAAPDEIEVFVTNMRPTMVTGSTHRVRFGARQVTPIKSFTDSGRFGNKFFLPSASHIGVQDAATKATVIPFDTGSLLSADGTGSFFDLKIENMYINRSYKILVRIEKPWGPEVVDTGHTFKVV